MALEQSILKSTKKNLGLDGSYTAFDQDVLTHINAGFFSLYQLGLGPSDGFTIEGDDEVWSEFLAEGPALNATKTYIYLKVRSLFDPPGTPHHITAMKEQIEELEYRLLQERELTQWTAPPSSPLSLP